MEDDDKKSEDEEDDEAFYDEEKMKRRKSRPSLKRLSTFNIEDELNEEEYNKFKMRGFYLHK